MKIEKLNDNQIRCTLTHADLAERQLQLSELAYGTEKAKSLFHDMMQQAAYEFGFEADDIPLMIEAIPASSDSIVLIITKVEDPEELDTRFSKFAPSNGDDNLSKKAATPAKLEGAETLMDLLGKLNEKLGISEDAQTAEAEGSENEPSAPALRLFSFSTIDNVLKASQVLTPMYHGSNTLYKDPAEDLFLLALTQSDHSINDFNRLCNMLSEYGNIEKAAGANLAFLEEHCEVILSTDAVQQLATI